MPPRLTPAPWRTAPDVLAAMAAVTRAAAAGARRGADDDRNPYRRPATPTPRLLRPCGTHAAWVRHHYRGEPIDAACEQAHQDHVEAYRALQRERASARRRPA